ncbi:MAG TPA: 4'-phosphopantetheinyl transferase superfamily protein [Polyangia bacterium]|nr:4'-phosphopantetheinyl transferase superfamily protein [Polyangia bacterium]
MAFERRFVRTLPFGICVGIALPDGPDRHDDDGARFELPAVLHPDEAAFARTLSPVRRSGWVGGRVALRAALQAVGVDATAPLLATPRGGPLVPAGAVGSVSHKSDLAVALAARAETPPEATLGIDVEVVRSFKHDIARHVLTAGERAVLPPEGPARDAEVLRLFSAKEAIYKALDPWVQRFISFQEAEIARASGGLTATVTLAQGEGPFAVELHDASGDGILLLAARATRR